MRAPPSPSTAKAARGSAAAPQIARPAAGGAGRGRSVRLARSRRVAPSSGQSTAITPSSAATTAPPCVAPGRSGTISCRRTASSERVRSSQARPSGVSRSLQSSFEASKEEASFGSGIRARMASSWKAGRWREVCAPTFADGGGKVALEVAEIDEGALLAPFLAHEQERDVGGEEEDRGQGADHRLRSERGQALSEGAVADLVVVLEEVEEGERRLSGARLAAGLAGHSDARARPGRRSLRRGRGRACSEWSSAKSTVVALDFRRWRRRGRRCGSRRSTRRCGGAGGRRRRGGGRRCCGRPRWRGGCAGQGSGRGFRGPSRRGSPRRSWASRMWSAASKRRPSKRKSSSQ